MFLELPKIIDSYGRTAIQLQEEIISVSMSHELAYLLGFVNHPTKGESLITSQNTTKHAFCLLIKDHPMVGFSIIFCIVILLNINLSEIRKLQC